MQHAIDSTPLIVVAETTVMMAIAMMAEHNSHYVLVVDRDRQNALVGILTERDLIRISLQSKPLDRLPIQAVMSHPAIAIPESAVNDLGVVMSLFERHGIRYLPILSANDRIVGAIDRDRLNKLLARQILQLEPILPAIGDIPANTVSEHVARFQCNRDLQQAERQLQYLIEGTVATTGKDFFPALMMWLAKALDISYAFVSEKVEDRLHVLAFWQIDRVSPTFTFPIARTPCERALQNGQYYCENLVQQEFPTHLDLVQMAAQSYLGVALQDGEGRSIGNLCVIDRKPIRDPAKAKSLLQVFAARAAAELERERAAQALAQLNQQLEQWVVERTAALQKSEHRYRALMEGANDAILLLNTTHGRIVESNLRAEILLGYSQSELSKINIRSIHPPEALNIVRQHIARLLQKGYETTLETLVMHKNGNLIYVEISPSLIYLEKERIIQVVFRDITDRKEYQQRLELSNAELMRATRLKDEFLANMSHELRTPLNAILGLSESLLEEIWGPMNDRHKQAISTIESSGEHLLALINDVLEVAKIGAGQLELEITTVSAIDLTNSTLAFIKQQAYKKQIQLTTNFAANLGYIDVDERRIRQVLINLLDNGVKFTPTGGRVTIEVKLEQTEFDPLATNPNFEEYLAADTWLLFVVTDTGIGISPENQAKLFQPFIQIDSSLSRHYEGTGLGLTLAKQIVELHGGSIDLVSELGCGSCFTVRLPYRFSPKLNSSSNPDALLAQQPLK